MGNVVDTGLVQEGRRISALLVVRFLAFFFFCENARVCNVGGGVFDLENESGSMFVGPEKRCTT